MSDDNNNNDTSVTSVLDTFSNVLSDASYREKLFLLAGALELLRQSKASLANAAVAEVLVDFPKLDWSRVPMSLTKTLLSDDYRQRVLTAGVPPALVDEVLFSGFVMFLTETAETTTPVDEQSLVSTIVSVADQVAFAARPRPPRPASTPATAPPIFTEQALLRVFQPAPWTQEIEQTLGARVIEYRAPLAGGTLGPTLRGIMFDTKIFPQHAILETGEHVRVGAELEHVRVVNTADEPAALSASALLSVLLAAEQLAIFGIISEAAATAITDKHLLGKIQGAHFSGLAGADDVKGLERVFDMGAEAIRMGAVGATGPVGASVRFPIPATDMHVVIDASHDTYGPYSTSRLVRANDTGTETVLMRREHPRLYSLRGTYLFMAPWPTAAETSLVSLTAMF